MNFGFIKIPIEEINLVQNNLKKLIKNKNSKLYNGLLYSKFIESNVFELKAGTVEYDPLLAIDYCDETTISKEEFVFSSNSDIQILVETDEDDNEEGTLILSESDIYNSTDNSNIALTIIFFLSKNESICFRIGEDKELVTADIEINNNNNEKEFQLTLSGDDSIPTSIKIIYFLINLKFDKLFQKLYKNILII